MYPVPLLTITMEMEVSLVSRRSWPPPSFFLIGLATAAGHPADVAC
jgi:hypothetical protein